MTDCDIDQHNEHVWEYLYWIHQGEKEAAIEALEQAYHDRVCEFEA